MRVARIFDKLEKRYSIPGMDATRGFQDCCEEASTAAPQEAPNREKLLHLWLAWVIFKVGEASRASKAKSDHQATQSLNLIEAKEQMF